MILNIWTIKWKNSYIKNKLTPKIANFKPVSIVNANGKGKPKKLITHGKLKDAIAIKDALRMSLSILYNVKTTITKAANIKIVSKVISKAIRLFCIEKINVYSLPKSFFGFLLTFAVPEAPAISFAILINSLEEEAEGFMNTTGTCMESDFGTSSSFGIIPIIGTL